MPCHPDRVHALPKGYQFGDAGKVMPLPLSEFQLLQQAMADDRNLIAQGSRLLTAADARWPTEPLGVRIENA